MVGAAAIKEDSFKCDNTECIPSGYKQTEVGVIPEDWETKYLGEITTLMTNGYVGTAKSHYTTNGKGVIYIQGYNVKPNSFNFNGIKFVTEEFHKSNLKSCLCEGDLLTVQTGDVGVTTVVPKHLIGANCHALIISRVKKSNNSIFVSHYLNSEYGRVRLKTIETGTTMKHLNVGDMLQFSIPTPPTKKEQEAIAAALSDADEWIASLEALIVKKQAIKQGAMQDMLSGKRRLDGFEGEWEEKRLGNSATLKARIGWQGLTTAEYQEVGNYCLVTGTEFTDGRIAWDKCHFVSEVRYRQDKNIQLHNNDVLVTKDGTIGKVAFVENIDVPATLNSGVFVIRPINNSFVPKFFFYLLKSSVFSEFLNQLSAGSTINHLYQKDFVHFKYKVPKEQKEQKAIAAILSDMDNEILQLEQKLEKAKQVKQGMMQSLLTGRIRLV